MSPKHPPKLTPEQERAAESLREFVGDRLGDYRPRTIEERLRASVALEEQRKSQRPGVSLFDVMAQAMTHEALLTVCEEGGFTIEDLKHGNVEVVAGRLVKREEHPSKGDT